MKADYLVKLSLKIFFICYVLFGHRLWAQEQREKSVTKYQIRTIAFYNLENLFDTINDPNTYDDDRTPEGKDQWTQKKLHHKIDQLAQVISALGLKRETADHPMEQEQISPSTEASSSNEQVKALENSWGADVLGVCEVENRMLLEQLTQHPLLAPFNYGIIHFESPDERGIDVALLYKKTAFIPASFNTHTLYLSNEMQYRDYTRDQLVVMGYLDGDPLWFLVNHWPSRSGGEARSRPHRLRAAQLNMRIIDSIRSIDPTAKIISMGDFNDNPVDNSFKQVLHTKSLPKDSSLTALFNPMESLYKKGFGSLAYRDEWSLFDQFYMSEALLEKRLGSYTFLKAHIFVHEALITNQGRYRGYPFRSYSSGTYQGGYSDHFPVQLFLIKKEVYSH